MNRWVWILVICILVIGIIATYFLWPRPATTPPPQNNPFGTGTTSAVTEQSPATFAIDFYTWYIAQVETDPTFPSPDTLQATLSPWLTSQFIGQWQQDADTLDADPVLRAQDDPRTWGSGVTAALIAQTDTTSTVTVYVGSGSTQHRYAVSLVKSTDGSWKIDSVESAS